MHGFNRPLLFKCADVFLSKSLSNFLTLHDIVNEYAVFDMFYCLLVVNAFVGRSIMATVLSIHWDMGEHGKTGIVPGATLFNMV